MPKRALVVDDSRMARVTLGKFLAEHKLAVDMAESAEGALGYLASNPPPHVIFMDHMMPGMDGLQAVEAIKKNSDTATIPIVMYTSKDGDLYMGQARALGAVGVLSKPINPLELQKIIQNLNLVADSPKAPAHSAVLEKNPPAETKASAAAVELALDDFMPDRREHQPHGEIAFLVKRLLEEQRAKMKQDLQVQGELIVHKVIERLQNPHAELAASTQNSERTPSSLFAKIGAFALVTGLLVAIAFLYSGYDDNPTKSKTMTENSVLPQGRKDVVAENSANPIALWERDRTEATDKNPRTTDKVENQAIPNEEKHNLLDTTEKQRLKSTHQERDQLLKIIEWMANVNSGFHYDQIPLGDERLATVSELVSRLSLIDFHGTLRLSLYSGDFCLVRSESGAFKLPSDDAPIQNCQLLTVSQEHLLPPRQSPAFARFLAASPYNNGNLRVEVVAYGKERPLHKYPSFSSVRTGGEWNRIASQNNRVEMLILPTSP